MTKGEFEAGLPRDVVWFPRMHSSQQSMMVRILVDACFIFSAQMTPERSRRRFTEGLMATQAIKLGLLSLNRSHRIVESLSQLEPLFNVRAASAPFFARFASINPCQRFRETNSIAGCMLLHPTHHLHSVLTETLS